MQVRETSQPHQAHVHFFDFQCGSNTRCDDVVRAYFVQATFFFLSVLIENWLCVHIGFPVHFMWFDWIISISIRKFIIASNFTLNRIQFRIVFPAEKSNEKLNAENIGHETNEKMPVAILFANYTHNFFSSLSISRFSFTEECFVRSFGTWFIRFVRSIRCFIEFSKFNISRTWVWGP